MTGERGRKAELYTRYPSASILIYNCATILHFLLGGLGIALGYGSSGPAWLFSGLYLLFAFTEMYVVMPLSVCPNCVYYRLKGSLCVSGLNLLSRRIAGSGRPQDFPNRGKGLLCPNNLYLAALVAPIMAIVPALVLDSSGTLLGLLLALIALLLFRFFVIFPRIACIHCRAKFVCPQAEAMGVRNR